MVGLYARTHARLPQPHTKVQAGKGHSGGVGALCLGVSPETVPHQPRISLLSP